MVKVVEIELLSVLDLGTSTVFCPSKSQARVVATQHGHPQCSFRTQLEQHKKAMDRASWNATGTFATPLELTNIPEPLKLS